MKNRELSLVLAGLLLWAAMPALAQVKSADEKRLETTAMEIDKDAVQLEDAKMVTDRLKIEFKATDEQMQRLRDQKLGYGEICIALSMAQRLPGGVTDENLQKVTALRQGPPVMGWGNVAKELGTKLGPVLTRTRKVSAQTRRAYKAERIRMEKMRAGEKGEKMQKMERMEKMEKMEKMDRPERPDMPMHGKP